MKQFVTFAFLAIVALGITLIALAHGTFSVISAPVASARIESHSA
ncbi:hypothetical protein MMUR_08860 [Mycolicibacterium murale]|uniref:Uncharacterized protein n=1 Tax=Mycolicibacterium murale TaxID=182220 RepID=A0A7I9WHI1_9MYCO|nr:hypothetical protein [Mycolicibacterium murale]GFG56750.1 hypothetical protein MMUR_08860 [Mycolicibacterium murale]